MDSYTDVCNSSGKTTPVNLSVGMNDSSNSSSKGVYPFMAKVNTNLDSDYDSESQPVEEWETQRNEELEEKLVNSAGNRKSKKVRELKMKLIMQNKCNCGRKRRGKRNCCHEGNFGNVVDKAFTVQRGECSSGSEKYIARSSARIKEALSNKNIGKNIFTDSNQERFETMAIGEQVGFVFRKESMKSKKNLGEYNFKC